MLRRNRDIRQIGRRRDKAYNVSMNANAVPEFSGEVKELASLAALPRNKSFYCGYSVESIVQRCFLQFGFMPEMLYKFTNQNGPMFYAEIVKGADHDYTVGRT